VLEQLSSSERGEKQADDEEKKEGGKGEKVPAASEELEAVLSELCGARKGVGKKVTQEVQRLGAALCGHPTVMWPLAGHACWQVIEQIKGAAPLKTGPGVAVAREAMYKTVQSMGKVVAPGCGRGWVQCLPGALNLTGGRSTGGRRRRAVSAR